MMIYEIKRFGIMKKFHLSKLHVLLAVVLVSFVALWANVLLLHTTNHNVPEEKYNEVFDKNSCVITISDWRHFGFSQTLFQSVSSSNPGARCFVWFVSDDPFIDKDNGGIISDKISEIKDIALNRGIVLVTLDQLSQFFDNFEIFPKLAFQNELSVDAMKSYILPFALKYTLSILYAGSVLYLDPFLWVSDNLNYILRKKEPHQSVVIRRQLSGEASFKTTIGFELVFMHNQEQALTFLQWWGSSYTWDWSYIYIEMSGSREWLCLQVNPDNNIYRTTLQSSGVVPSNFGNHKKIVFTDFWSDIQSLGRDRYNSSGSNQRQTSSIASYLRRLGDQKSQYFEDIPYGFNHFSNGLIVEPWMRTHYSEMMSPVLCAHDGILLENTPSVYTRIHFQETVFISNPFEAIDPRHGRNMTFLQWLLKGPSSQAVDMEGRFYFSEIEEQIYNSLRYYPIGEQVDPQGDGYGKWKSFFQETYKRDHISLELHKRVLSTDAHHRMNHEQFHKTSFSSSDVGVNVIGWHGGVFGIAKTSGKMYQAAKVVEIGANAIEIRPEPVHTYLHPRVLGYPLSRSCSEQVNLVMMNPDHWHIIQKDIPKVIWDHKYNIGYWEWELETFPESLMSYSRYYDEIWAPSQFTAHSFVNSKGYNGFRVRVLPLPLTSEIAERKQSKLHSQSLQSLLDEVRNRFVFLTVFDCHSVASRQRKNPEATIKAFLRAFPSGSHYHLIVKSHHATENDLKEFAELTHNDPRIHFFSDALSNDDHYALQERADCFVSLHRSEGFGMNILEEMGRGIPVITTNYSGNVDFFPSVNKFLGTCIFAVPYELVTLKESYDMYLAGYHWAEADQKYAANAMVTVARNDCKKKFSKEISNLVLSTFGAKAVGEKLRSLLEESRPLIQAKEKRMQSVSS